MSQRSVRTRFTFVPVVATLALLASTLQPLSALAAPPKMAQVTTANMNTTTLNTTTTTTTTPTNVCSLYPIALHTSSIAGKQPAILLATSITGPRRATSAG